MDKQIEMLTKYPKILKNLGGDPRYTCMSWEHGGISVGKGWMPLLEKLFGFLQHHTDKNNYPQVVADQIKEKFGTLCFYYTIEPNAEPKESKTDAFMEGAIAFAESMSATICEVCGKPGKLQKEHWLSVRCEDHK